MAQAQAPDHDTAGDADSIQAVELPPLAGPPSVMNVIVVAAECAPWSKTGTMKNLYYYSDFCLTQLLCICVHFLHYVNYRLERSNFL